MKILWSIHLYYPDHACGSESMAHHINRYLISKGHQVRVMLHQSCKSQTPYVYEGVEVFGGRVAQRVDAYQWADVIFTHLDFTQFSIAMAMQAKRPLVHFIHNDIAYSSIQNAVKSQHVVYNSEWIRDAIGYPWPSYVLHPPCDAAYYNVNENPEWNNYITLISLNERKGGYLFAKIAEAMPDRRFMGVMGSYDNAGRLKLSQPQIANAMPSNVVVMPNSPDILSVYRQTRLLLMPSDYESWGRTATEAMCNGIPVICTPTPGLKENCGQAADYVGRPIPSLEPGAPCVDTGAVEDWIRAIKKFDRPEYYRKKSLLCRDRAAQLNPTKELEGLEQFIMNARF